MRTNEISIKFGKRSVFRKTMLLAIYFLFGTAVFYLILSVLSRLGAPADFISDVASIGEVVAAVVAAVMIIYQLEQERAVEEQENRIQEANFMVQCNEFFLENEKMQYVESKLTAHYMNVSNLKDMWADKELQQYINYLVYLEEIAPLVLEDIMLLENIDNLFAYRYFIAVNNPILQEKTLNAYDGFYKGCFRVYKKWRNYRLNTYCISPYNEKYKEVIPLAEYELDQLDCFKKYGYLEVKGSKMKTVCRQLKENQEIKMSKLYGIAKLIYDTDPYIYPAMFENKVDAIELIVQLIKSNTDSMFSLNNIFVIENDEEIMGIILWKKGGLQWSKCKFIDMAKKCNIAVSKHLDYVYEKYISLYDDENLAGKISLINVCVGKEYRGLGLGKVMMATFMKKHINEKMELCVLKDNSTAIKLYQEFGFEVVAERDGFSIDKNSKPACLEMIRL